MQVDSLSWCTARGRTIHEVLRFWQIGWMAQTVCVVVDDIDQNPPGTAKLTTATVAKILALTCSKPPGQVTHWTGRAMAEATGIACARCSASGMPITCRHSGHPPKPHTVSSMTVASVTSAITERFAGLPSSLAHFATGRFGSRIRR